MASNFLGDVGGLRRGSAIISSAELIAREGVELHKGMNFRDNSSLLSVFLVLPREGGFTDEWHEASETYVYEGHDSTTLEGGASIDQLLMYPGGRVTENGKFFKAANAFTDGVRKEPLQVQVYEKLDPGVWYDKGIFNLMEAQHEPHEGRKVFRFYLAPAQVGLSDDELLERMLSASVKADAWAHGNGRCTTCGEEKGLHFVETGNAVALRCAEHGGRKRSGLLG